MENIDAHINHDKKILDDPQISAQARRHTQEELAALESYKDNHPENNRDPSSLELYCDSNPNAEECKIFDL